MSYVGVEPVTQADWRVREGVTEEATSTLEVGGGYQVGYVEVYIEGRRLNEGDDYTATDGLYISLTETLPIGTNYAIEILQPYEVSNVDADTVQGSKYTVSATAPVAPVTNDIWFDIS